MPSTEFWAEIPDLTQPDLEILSVKLSQRFQEDPKALRRFAERVLTMPGTREGRPAFRQGIRRASEIPPGEDPVRLWFGLYPASVVLLIGETHAGKSSLLYNVAIHAARNEPLWDIKYGLGRPLHVLYIDPENAGNNCAKKLDRINEGRPDTLIFHDWRQKNLANALDQGELSDYLQEEQIDLCILDPITNIFNTLDENDNAEAARQMKDLIAISRETNACLLIVHHTGKDSSGNYGRGASARLAAADVGLVFRTRGNTEERDDDYTGEMEERDDVCRLQIIKNRFEGRASIFPRMAGADRFERVTFNDWKAAGESTGASKPPKRVQAQEEIYHCLADGNWYALADILHYCKNEEIGEHNTNKALRSMLEERIIERRREAHGKPFYRLIPLETRSAESQPPIGDCDSADLTKRPYREDDDADWR
jgi:hypothetical protein